MESKRAPGLENAFMAPRGVESTFPHVEADESRGGTGRSVKCGVTQARCLRGRERRCGYTDCRREGRLGASSVPLGERGGRDAATEFELPLRELLTTPSIMNFL
jgi:hypothetical protein